MMLNVAVLRTEFAADVLMINIFQIYDGKYTEVFESCNGKYNKESKCCKKYCKYLHFKKLVRLICLQRTGCK